MKATRLHQMLQPRRRGAALLIVLATLMITVVAASILLSAAADARLQHELASCEAIAQDMLIAAEEPIQWWLERESSKVVLPPDAAAPAVSVLSDRLRIRDDGDAWNDSDARRLVGGLEVELTITAFDQCGMAPLQAARSGSPLRLALPADVLALVDAAKLPPVSDPTPLGLDLVRDAALDDSWIGDEIRVFPNSPAFPARTFIVAGGPAPLERTLANTQVANDDTLAVGALVATHNRDPVRININTSPIPLVEAALRLAGRGGIDQIIQARSEGRRVTSIESSPAPAAAPRSATTQTPQIVASSDRWAFRIDIRVQRGQGTSLRHSWWAIYGPPASPHTSPPTSPPTRPRTNESRGSAAAVRSGGATWRCLQRLPITE